MLRHSDEDKRYMSSNNGHDHENRDAPEQRVNRRPLAIALAITTLFLIAEVIGGIITNSLALLADAGHMATDVAALGLALFAIWLAGRPATPERSFGFYRAEILAAFVNAASLVAISIYIFWEAFKRFGDPPEVQSGLMLTVAVAGLGANAASAWVLSRGGGHEHNLNTRGAFLHVIGDMLGSIGAIIAGVVMLLTGQYWVDPVLSAGIGLLILFSAWRLLKESVNVLLEATPSDIDPAEVRAAVKTVDGIEGVHDMHIWTVTSGLVSMSAHVEVSADCQWHEALNQMHELLREQFGISHATFQPEDHATHASLFQGCSLDTPEGRSACMVDSPAAAIEVSHGHRH